MSKVLLVLALICFVLSALSFAVAGFSALPLIGLGLAFQVSSSLV